MERAYTGLLNAGMSPAKARYNAERFTDLASVFRDGELVADAEPRAFWIPGRIEFLGKHTDYAGGRSLLCTVERGICLLAAERRDRRLRVRDASDGDVVDFPLDPDLVPEAGHWSNYPMTVARRIVRNFPGALRGADIVFANDLPRAAGLSSSSALVTATFMALSEINDLASRAEYRDNIRNLADVAGYLGTVENGQSFGALGGDLGVGTFGGSEDHTAILCSRPGALVQYAFCPVRFERTIPLPGDHLFVIAASGVQAEKTGAARERYNRASRAMEAIADCWRQAIGRADPTVAAAVASAPDAPDRMRACLRDSACNDFPASALLDRLEHFLAENETILPGAAEALAHGAYDTLGALVDRSQQDAEQLLGNQVPETSALARLARELGAAAASAFGAGFGGSVWALVRSDSEGAAEFREQWAARYAAAFPGPARHANFFITRAGPATTRL